MATFRVAKADKYGLEGWVVERAAPGEPETCVGLLYGNPVDAQADANRLNSFCGNATSQKCRKSPVTG